MIGVRTQRFIETVSIGAWGKSSLNEMTSFFAKAPEDMDLYEALLIADLDASFIMTETKSIVSKQPELLERYGLTLVEAQCIAMFTLEVPPERGKSPYKVINDALCGDRNRRDLSNVRCLIVFLLKSLRKLPKVENTVLYRGITSESGEVLEKGHNITFWGFASTSTKPILFPTGCCGRVIEIEGPVSGYDIREFSQFPEECEIVLEPETTVQVLGHKDQLIVKCRVLESCEPVLPGIVSVGILERIEEMLKKEEGEKVKMYLKRNNVSPEDVYQYVVSKGDGCAIHELGLMYKDGQGVAVDNQRAKELFELGVEKGNSDAMLDLGVMFHDGVVVDVDKKKAKELFERASERGNIKATYNLAVLLYYGGGVPVDKKKAIELFERASDQGVEGAMFNLGAMYYNGDGVALDKKKAKQLFERAVDKGYANAMYPLGLMYCDGDEVAVDMKKAIELFERGAEKGDVDSMYQLGRMYHYGEGVPVDLTQAVKFYERAVEKGHAESMCNLGLMYQKGEGVTADKQKARELYERASEKGQVNALYNLGFMYHFGDGVPVDKTTARTFYERAAELGYAQANECLKLL